MDLVLSVLPIFLLALIAPYLFRLSKKNTGLILALIPAAVCIYWIANIGHIESGATRQFSLLWIPSLGINLSFYADGLSLLFIILISGIGALVLIFAGAYLSGNPLLGRFYLYILFFMGAMLGLVIADNLLILFVFWELTSISSYLLIGFEHEKEASRRLSLQALLVTGGGGLALLAGLILIGLLTGSYEFTDLLQNPDIIRSHSLYLPILILVLLGVFTKSAQVPFHFWLPGAMVAPTPVSAYLHSATMVKAGIFLLARMNPILGGTDAWHYIISIVGVITMVTGAVMAVVQTDLKRLLAYSTVSALGTIVLLLGLGTVMATKAAVVFLIVHSLYKGGLFMIAGTIDHETGTRDVTCLGGLVRFMPITAIAAGLAALSMSGFPPLLGFISKELIYEAKLQLPALSGLVTTAGILANVVNVAVAIIVGIAPFWDDEKIRFQPEHEAPLSFWVGPLILSMLGLISGLFSDLIGRQLIAPAVSAVRAEETLVRLKLWHGISPVLMLSVATLLTGIGLFFIRHVLRRLAANLKILTNIGPGSMYKFMIDGVLRFAAWQTRIIQNGYQSIYTLVIFAATVLLILLTFSGSYLDFDWFMLTDVRYDEVLLIFIMLIAGFSVIKIKSRLGAVIALGVIGYSIALLYVLYGAPDLAITQILVETLTVILFVFVIYHLPRFTELSSRAVRIRDAVVSILFGSAMTIMMLKAISIPHAPISDFFMRNSYLQAFGKNVVNVILVDFRSLDTLGEITVLSVAALGVYALLKFKTTRGKQP